MSDRIFYAGAAVLALALVGLALVYPQGEGRRAPEPFGAPVHISDAARADLKAQTEKLHPKPPAPPRAAEVQTGARSGAQSGASGLRPAVKP